jgi:hypothetical protein
MSAITKPDGSEFVIPEDQKWATEQSLALIPEVFNAK